MIKFLPLLLILFSLSCTKKKQTPPHLDVIEVKKDKIHLLFSHNINGETHPCGCRHFPLGGLPQVAGKLHELSATGEVFLLDTGDLLFPSPNLPPTMKDSFTFGAKNLSKGMSQIGLRYFVPGDQDFALGIEFLRDLIKESNYKLLISNLKEGTDLPHKRLVILEKGDHKVYMVGVVDPTVLSQKANKFFEAPSKVMPSILEELKKNGYDEKNQKHRLVLLSHSGMPNDQALAKKFPVFDWVMGAHTQSFTKIPYQEGKTKLTQVLSRNHYLGEVEVDLKAGKKADKWQLHEIRDELKEKLKPNPFEDFITKHKEEVKRIQIQEQGSMGHHANSGAVKLNTASSCIECHQPQVDFWSGTAHSIAYATLINANEDRNLTCIGCHSVGFQSDRGYMLPDGLVIFEKEAYEVKKTEGMSYSNKDKKEAEKLAALKKSYWKDVSAAFKGVGSIRDLPKDKVIKLSKKWLKHDEKSKVTHNFANVQCLNCHTDMHFDHPFAIPPEVSAASKKEKMRENCMNCHVPDQSPEWYEVQDNGKAGRPKYELIDNHIKALSCPKNES